MTGIRLTHPNWALAVPYYRLRVFNLGLAALHLFSLILIAALSTSTWPVYVTRSDSRWVPINATSAESCDNAPCRITVSYTRAFEVSIEYLVLAFHAPAVLSHLYAGLSTKRAYAHAPRVPHRWLEYAVSASIMMVCILLLTGITDFWTLLFAFTLCAGTQAMGYLGEREPRSWLYFYVGCFLMLPIWTVVYYSFYKSMADAVKDPPTFVYWIVWTLLLLFMCFAVVDYGLRRRWQWLVRLGAGVPWVGAEYMYMILSLTAKSLLAWQIFFGALSREKNDLVAYDP